MKSTKYIILAVIGSLFLTACEDINTLKRDNPLDRSTNANIKSQILFSSFSIYYDNNYNKVVNPGETIQIYISLKNTGSNAVNGVKATFSTTNSYISDFSPINQVNYGTIRGNQEKWMDFNGSNTNGWTIRFTVSSTTPAGTKISVDINIIDENGNTWTDSFHVPVEASR